jgi:hypothetical protein
MSVILKNAIQTAAPPALNAPILANPAIMEEGLTTKTSHMPLTLAMKKMRQ